MEYSSDDIAAARSLQVATYIYVSTATFWTYDYVCSLHEEWTFLLQSHWNKVKVMYIVTRYLFFFILISNLYASFISNENLGTCRVSSNIGAGLDIVSAMFSECFFILRTYALWNSNRIVLAVMLSTFFVSFQPTRYTKPSDRRIGQTFSVASIGVTFAGTVPSAYLTSAIPGITACYQTSTNIPFFIPFILLSIFQLGLMMLTLIRAVQTWRKHPSRLFVVLVNHNISYYTCGLLISVTNILASLFLQVCGSPKIPFQSEPLVFRVLVRLRQHVASSPVRNPCNPRHTFAPPSLADEPTCIQLWGSRAYYDV
ncbi:hypothetical protein CY34DRAFT_11894 [Suillus luteus UH-Slu-Lm8-n1]|uniref:Unplaced genomic scaffold CY34scaffold_88, whole genome shotgun sequence n=1 Tax=Suillus luteus UH-Slu-Lm8-n1 TaxID=930992 RepID=A0A0C9ZZT0_9AGAM|nr:hypothetical protein CY34DRAFT_11894 [Suillus luteus UH-Slu-Lm8-n1]